MIPKEKLAVQSYCLRGFKNNLDVAAKVAEIGLSAIELCAVHADFLDEDSFEKVVEIYSDAGIDIVSVGVQGFKGDLDNEEKFFRFAQIAGAKHISANFAPESVPESFDSAARLADKYDIKLGIHNHGGKHWLGSSQMLRTVLAKTSPRIGLMLDTAWALDAGENPIAMAEEFKDRLFGLHLKDFVFDRARKPEDVIVGEGNLDIVKLSALLNEIDYNGLYVLEYEGDVENPVPALKKCVEAIS
jgi:sugar phosphate isomerase/epimerase